MAPPFDASAHTSLGLLVLLLSLGRLAWRLYSPPPGIHGTGIVQLAARAGHAVLSFCTIALALTGLTRTMAAAVTLSSSGSRFRPGLAAVMLSWLSRGSRTGSS